MAETAEVITSSPETAQPLVTATPEATGEKSIGEILAERRDELTGQEISGSDIARAVGELVELADAQIEDPKEFVKENLRTYRAGLQAAIKGDDPLAAEAMSSGVGRWEREQMEIKLAAHRAAAEEAAVAAANDAPPGDNTGQYL